MKRREKRELKERHFKVNETIFEATKTMDDKTAGRFFKSVCDYAFNGKAYDGNNVVISRDPIYQGADVTASTEETAKSPAETTAEATTAATKRPQPRMLCVFSKSHPVAAPPMTAPMERAAS